MLRTTLLLIAALLLYTVPGRGQWNQLGTSLTPKLGNVHFTNAQTGIISIPMSDYFLRTTNGGFSWDTVRVPFLTASNQNLTALQFVDALNGFACGKTNSIQGMLLATSDGGQTWDSLIMSRNNTIKLKGLCFKNTDTGILNFNDRIYQTFDHGKTLTKLSMPEPMFIEQAILLENNAILVAGMALSASNTCKVYRSGDWGVSWTEVYSDSAYIFSIALKNETGIISCSNGVIARTTDNGYSWVRAKLSADSMNFPRVKVGCKGEFYMLGWTNNNDGYFYASNDGRNWNYQRVTVAEQLIDLSMPDLQTGYIISYHSVYKTANGAGMGLAVAERSTAKELGIYPNPATDFVSINNTSKQPLSSIMLYDMKGAPVKEFSPSEQRLGLADVPKGAYLLKLSSGNESASFRLITE